MTCQTKTSRHLHIVYSKNDPINSLWGDQRIEFRQKLWGNGSLYPYNQKLYADIKELVAAKDKMSVLDLNPEIGCSIDFLSNQNMKHIKAITSDEWQNYLLNNKYKQEDKVKIGRWQSNNVISLDKSFDLILANYFFYQFFNKKHLIEQVSQALKSKGTLVIQDFMKGKQKNSFFPKVNPECQGNMYKIFSENQYEELFNAHNFTVKQKTDKSEWLKNEILDSFDRLVENNIVSEFTKKDMFLTIQETQNWIELASELEAETISFKQFIIEKN